MAQFVYSTRLSIDAPLLIDRQALEELDSLLAEEEQRLLAANERAIQSKAEREAGASATPAELADRVMRLRRGYPYSKRDRCLTLHFGREKRCTADNLREMLRQPEVHRELATGFTYTITTGEVQAEIEAKKSLKSLDIKVSPEYLPESREFFASLQQWAAKLSPPKWQRVLSGWGSAAAWAIFIFVAMVSLMVASDREKEKGKRELRTQAVQLLTNGLQVEEQIKALEIVLALNSGYLVPEAREQSTNYSPRYWFVFFSSLTFCVVISIWPSVEIGIGKGERRIPQWRRWFTVIFYSIPAWIFAAFFLPKLEALILSFFS